MALMIVLIGFVNAVCCTWEYDFALRSGELILDKLIDYRSYKVIMICALQSYSHCRCLCPHSYGWCSFQEVCWSACADCSGPFSWKDYGFIIK